MKNMSRQTDTIDYKELAITPLAGGESPCNSHGNRIKSYLWQNLMTEEEMKLSRLRADVTRKTGSLVKQSVTASFENLIKTRKNCIQYLTRDNF